MSRVPFWILALFLLVGGPVSRAEPRNRAAEPGTHTREPFGVCIHADRPDAYRRAAGISRALKLVKKAKIEWLRVRIRWHLLEPQQGRINGQYLKRVDYTIRQADRLGIRVYIQLVGTPKWASPKPETEAFWAYMPKSSDAFEEHLRFVVGHYRGRVLHYEIGNEIDWISWRSSLENYGRHLRTAYKTIKEVDRHNKILLGALATDGVHAFRDGENEAKPKALQRLYNRGITNYFDIISLHSYPDKPQTAKKSVEKVKTTYEIMKKNGDADKKIWVTELGLSAKNELTEEQKAAELTSHYDALLKLPYVEKIFWSKLRSEGKDSDSNDGSFAILNNDFSPRKAYEAFKEYINEADDELLRAPDVNPAAAESKEK